MYLNPNIALLVENMTTPQTLLEAIKLIYKHKPVIKIESIPSIYTNKGMGHSLDNLQC